MYIASAIALFAIIGLGWYVYERFEEPKLGPGQIENESDESASDVKDIAYYFDGRPVKLEKGIARAWIAPNSQAQMITKYFGNETLVDLNGDGKKDVVLYLTQEVGGSGIFYYVAVALTSKNGYQGTEAYLLGDRIAPQPTTINETGTIFLNYADRKIGDSFADVPSVGKTLKLKLDLETKRFGIVADQEGEADPTRMTLDMKTWEWQGTQLSNKTMVSPGQLGKFALAFTVDGKVSVRTDCNAVSGMYTTTNKKLTFDQFVSTKMFCENSQEDLFVKELSAVTNYLFTGRGELKLTLKDNAGTMTFK